MYSPTLSITSFALVPAVSPICFIFSEKSDVQIYHAIAYLYYRLEFLWRNNRIDASLKLFRFYILWAAFRESTNSADFLRPMKNQELIDHSEAVIKFASNEYFNLVNKEKGLAQYLAIGKQIVVVWEGKVYRIIE